MKIETELTRAQLRYHCYAMREQGECDPKAKPLLDKIEEMEHFDGWKNFAMTWDFITHGGEKVLTIPLKLRWKKFSEAREWEATVDKLASKPTKMAKGIAEFKKGPRKKK